MAARTQTSVLVMVSLAIVSVVALALFVTTVVFASRAQQAQRDLAEAERDRNEAVSPQEADLFARLQQAAGGDSVVGHLNENYETLSDLAVGRRNRAPDEIRATFNELLGEGEYDNLQSAVSGLLSENATLERELAEARRSAERARTDLANANDELESVRAEFQQAFDRQRASVDQAFDNASAYSADLESAKDDFRREANRLKRDAEELARQKDRRINELLDDVARLEQTVAELTRTAIQPLSVDADTLTDGTVVGTNLANNEVFISLGREDRVPNGITFQVFNAETRVQPDEEGNIPDGKATIEVIRLDRDTSVARILRSRRGDAIIPGDIIVNTVYDPDTRYEFVVFGDFDVNNDFVATPQETDDIRAIIREWGGDITDELGGTTDYVVLGERPVLPPEPRSDDPTPVVQRYAEARAAQLRYDELLEKATATHIPVLNQNRLFNLTGIRDRR